MRWVRGIPRTIDDQHKVPWVGPLGRLMPFCLTGGQRYVASRVSKLSYRASICVALICARCGRDLRLAGTASPVRGAKLGAARSSPSILKEDIWNKPAVQALLAQFSSRRTPHPTIELNVRAPIPAGLAPIFAPCPQPCARLLLFPVGRLIRVKPKLRKTGSQGAGSPSYEKG